MSYQQLPTTEEGRAPSPPMPPTDAEPMTGAGAVAGAGSDADADAESTTATVVEPMTPIDIDSKMDRIPSSRSQTLQTAMYMAIWIVTSNFTILFNKWIIDTAGFGYPVLLTCWHLTFAAIVTQILARTTTLLDSRHALPVDWSFYMKTILPIGLASSGSLVCANFVYLYLSVAFIQMIKASSPVIVLFVSWIMGVVNPTMGNIINILVIVSGVALASAGEFDFSWIGFAFQFGGIIFEAIRVVMIQIMLSAEGLKMDALVGLYYYAPVCAAFNLIIALFVEIPKFQISDLDKVGIPVLLLNASVAFLLNFASMVLIGRTSGLVTTLTGIFKNILLIGCSVLIWGTHISGLQIFGYGITLCALIYYSLGLEKLISTGELIRDWAAGVWTPSSSEKNTMRLIARRVLIITLIVLLSGLSYVGWRQGSQFFLSSWNQ